MVRPMGASYWAGDLREGADYAHTDHHSGYSDVSDV